METELGTPGTWLPMSALGGNLYNCGVVARHALLSRQEGEDSQLHEAQETWSWQAWV